mgnify:FL=1
MKAHSRIDTNAINTSVLHPGAAGVAPPPFGGLQLGVQANASSVFVPTKEFAAIHNNDWAPGRGRSSTHTNRGGSDEEPPFLCRSFPKAISFVCRPTAVL